MIARFQFLLPFDLAVAPALDIEPFNLEWAGEHVRVYPPHRSTVPIDARRPNSPMPASAAVDGLGPAPRTPTSETVTLDGNPAFFADVLQVDVFGRDFDRHRTTDDPPTQLALDVANWVITGFRVLGRAGWARPLPTERVEGVWRMTFLGDDESVLESTAELYRQRAAASGRSQAIAVGLGIWAQIQEIPHDYEPAPWDDLILDAFDSTSQIGSALVLAFTAVETRLENALDVLAGASEVTGDLWSSINNRDDFRKAPSVTEQADDLMKIVSGRSLKDDSDLWTIFQNLRKARNSFVHDGRPLLGGARVTDARGRELVAGAQRIIDWIDQLLPTEHRRVELREPTEVQTIMTLLAPGAEAGPTTPAE